MKKQPNGIVILNGWIESMRTITDHVARSELAEAIINYAYDGTPYTGKKEIVKVLMATISNSIDFKKLQREQNRENGSKGGNPALKGIQANNSDNRKDNQADNQADNRPDKPVKEKDIDIEPANAGIKKKKKEIIIPIPSIEEVEEYIKSKGYDIDARAFWAYYDAREWMKDGKPIKNWHLQVATWVNNSNRYDKGKRKPIQTLTMQRPAEPERDRDVPLLEGNIPGVDYEYIKRLREEQERKGKLKPKD